MPRISRARATLQQLLATETNPQKQAELASRLAAVIDAEGRERGRRRRARKQIAQPAQTAPDDGAEEFSLDPPVPQPPTLPPTPEQLLASRQIMYDLGILAEPPAPVIVAPTAPAPAPPQNGYGVTRVLPCLAPPAWNCERGYYEEEFAPHSSVGLYSGVPWVPWLDDAISSNSYNSADGFSFQRRDPKTGEHFMTNQRLERERKEQDQQWRDLADAWGW